MAKLVFENIGRGKWNGVVDIKDDLDAQQIIEIAYREVKKHLASKFPDVEYDAVSNKGTVCAGFRTLGTFHKDNDNGE